MLLLPVSRYAEMSTRLLIKSLCRYRSSLPPLSLLVDIIWEHYHATSPMTRRRKKTSGINRQEANAKKSWLYKHQFGWWNKIILQYNSPTEHHRFFNSLCVDQFKGSTSLPSLWQLTSIWLSSVRRGRRIWTVPWQDREFEPEVSCFSRGIFEFYLWHGGV